MDKISESRISQHNALLYDNTGRPLVKRTNVTLVEHFFLFHFISCKTNIHEFRGYYQTYRIEHRNQVFFEINQNIIIFGIKKKVLVKQHL